MLFSNPSTGLEFELTAYQFYEELVRYIKSGVLNDSDWSKLDVKDYLRVSRVGASFTLNRVKRLTLMSYLHDSVQEWKRMRKQCTYSPRSYKIEGAILKEQEDRYGEYIPS